MHNAQCTMHNPQCYHVSSVAFPNEDEVSRQHVLTGLATDGKRLMLNVEEIVEDVQVDLDGLFKTRQRGAVKWYQQVKERRAEQVCLFSLFFAHFWIIDLQLHWPWQPELYGCGLWQMLAQLRWRLY